MAALADAAEADEYDAPTRIAEARRRLLAMRLRIRRDLDLAPEPARPSLLRRAARTSASISRQLIPVAAAATVSVGAESLFPGGSSLAGPGAAWAMKVGEKWVELATSHVLGGALDVPAYDEEPRSRQHLSTIELPDVAPADEHARALAYALDLARHAVHGPGAELSRHIADARRHYDRLLVLDDRPSGWCATHEQLDESISRLERLSASPTPCPSTVDAVEVASDLAQRVLRDPAAYGSW
ncbi:hypothetical protein WCD74_01540 [Actinomycetospora sp. OC33-EN08]|uniref:DUF4439 domain-containing protein n=1 Tax=Actinomycetospora aurantiaca TaxID=3129233 RepID=A0ABU8MHK7_9PSEU